MKLSNQATRKIQDIIAALDRGLAFIDAEQTKIVRLSNATNFPRDTWTSGENQTGVAIEKQIGSELCYLRNARRDLKQLITPVIHEP